MTRPALKQDAPLPPPCRDDDRIERIIAALENETNLTDEDRAYLRELLARRDHHKQIGTVEQGAFRPG